MFPAEFCRSMSNGTSVIKEIHLKNWFLASCLSRSLKVIGNDTARYAIDDFLLTFHSNREPILYRLRDKRRSQSKIGKFSDPRIGVWLWCCDEQQLCLPYCSRYKHDCACVTVSGSAIIWATSARYLGIYLEVSAKFKCSFATNKAKFSKAFNIFGKVGRNASEEVLSKCLPILFYGIEACPINSTVRRSLEFTMNKILFKIFGAMSTDSFRYVWECFGIDPLEQLIQERQDKLNTKYSACDNLLYLVICRH